MNFVVCIPTYKRKYPNIIKLIYNQPDISFLFCVRHEELISGFYNNYKKIKHIKLIDIGSNIIDIGDTRKKIIDYCIDNKIEYCLMLDDTVDEFFDISNKKKTLSQIIQNCILQMQTDKLSQYIVGFSFFKYRNIDENGKIININLQTFNVKYFGSIPYQAILLDIKKIYKYHLNYASIKKRGIEDNAFFGICLKAGLIFCFNKNIVFSATFCNIVKDGGNHFNQTIKENEKKYDKMCMKCFNYLHMQGLSLFKMTNFKGQYYMQPVWDIDYFRDALCVHRKEYAKVIASHFNLPTCK